MPLTPDQEAALQRGWFALLPPVLQAAVAARGQLRRYARDATVHVIDDEPGGMWGVLSGGLKV